MPKNTPFLGPPKNGVFGHKTTDGQEARLFDEKQSFASVVLPPPQGSQIMTIWGGGILKNRSILRRILDPPKSPIFDPPPKTGFSGFFGGHPWEGGVPPSLGVKIGPYPPPLPPYWGGGGGGGKDKFASCIQKTPLPFFGWGDILVPQLICKLQVPPTAGILSPLASTLHTNLKCYIIFYVLKSTKDKYITSNY